MAGWVDDRNRMNPKTDKLTSILSGSKEDLELIRQVRERIGATSNRETVRRMAIFCSVMLEQQEAGNQILIRSRENGGFPALIWTL